jgi:hypothetical protein
MAAIARAHPIILLIVLLLRILVVNFILLLLAPAFQYSGPSRPNRASIDAALQRPVRPTGANNQYNRQISSLLHVLLRTPAREIWRPLPIWRASRPLETAALHDRNLYRSEKLRSPAVASGKTDWRLSALAKAPLSVVFPLFFDDFLRVFPRACPGGREWARIRPRNVPRLNWPRSRPETAIAATGGLIIVHNTRAVAGVE